MLVHNLLSRAADRRPEDTAIIAGTSRISFRELDENSDRLAAVLQRFGVKRGDRVAAMLENSVEFVVTLWAALKAGAVFVPINHATKGATLGYILADAGARCLVVQGAYQARVAEAAPSFPPAMTVIWTGPQTNEPHVNDLLAGPHTRPAPPGLIDQDLCLLIYTSGSTGKPKGVMLTHHAVGNNAWAISTYLRAVPEDVVLGVLPMSFGYGLFQLLTGAYAAFAVVVERSFTFPVEVLKQTARHGVTGLPAVPGLLTRLLELAPFKGYDLSRLRYITNAAAPLPPLHITRLREVLPHVQVFSMYGLTECTRVCYMDPARLDTKTASVGKAMPNCEAFVVNEAGERRAAGEVGELVVRGSNIMRGYWRRPDATAKALTIDPQTGDRLLHTGDLFYMDEEEDLFFVGRRDDMFKCRGEKVAPRIVENALHDCEQIAEAAVIGVADPVDGMAVKAYVVLREGQEISAEALRRFCAARLETWLVPKLIEFCAVLPKTESGKVTRKVLRERARAAANGDDGSCAA